MDNEKLWVEKLKKTADKEMKNQNKPIPEW